MNLYNLTANSYGPTWFVCAESREAAIAAFREAIEREYREQVAFHLATPQAQVPDHVVSSRDHALECLQHGIDGSAAYPGGERYSIDEIAPGVPVFSEVA